MKQIDREFVGFFFGDGSATLLQYNRKTRYKGKVKDYLLTRVQLAIVQRADNLPLLKKIQKRYGGSIYKRNVNKHNMAGTKPAFQWIMTNFVKVKKLTDILLQAEFPYRNIDAVKLVNEYCIWRSKQGTKLNGAKFPKEWKERLKKSHKYQE